MVQILRVLSCQATKLNKYQMMKEEYLLDHLRELVDEETAGMMLTQPNTLGLFEDKIEDIYELIHSNDGLMYMDGANLNALVGMVDPSKMGFDITI